jgi:hypothetical protein
MILMMKTMMNMMKKRVAIMVKIHLMKKTSHLVAEISLNQKSMDQVRESSRIRIQMMMKRVMGILKKKNLKMMMMM